MRKKPQNSRKLSGFFYFMYLSGKMCILSLLFSVFAQFWCESVQAEKSAVTLRWMLSSISEVVLNGRSSHKEKGKSPFVLRKGYCYWVLEGLEVVNSLPTSKHFMLCLGRLDQMILRSLLTWGSMIQTHARIVTWEQVLLTWFPFCWYLSLHRAVESLHHLDCVTSSEHTLLPNPWVIFVLWPFPEYLLFSSYAFSGSAEKSIFFISFVGK